MATSSTMTLAGETAEVTDITGKGLAIRIDDSLGRQVVLHLDRMDARALASLAKTVADVQAQQMGEPHSPKRTVGMIEVDETHVRAFRTNEVSADFEPHEAFASELRCDRDGSDGMVALQVARMARENFSHLAHVRMWGDTRAEVIA